MHYFMRVLRKYFVFSGRASRSEYWYFTLFYLLSIMLTAIVDVVSGTFDAQIGFGWLSGTFFILTFAPMLGVSIRRLHDVGRSGWWVLLGFVPVVGGFALLVIAMFDSQPGTNSYGDHPADAADLRARTSANVVARTGSSRLRRALKGGAMVIAALLVVAGAGGYWWSEHGSEWLAAGEAAKEVGRQAGRTLEEGGCVAQALHRRAADRSLSLASSVASDLTLSGCLQTSHIEASFCDGVPSQDDILATSAWVATACSANGLSDVYCSNLFMAVARYCASPGRVAKLSLGKKSAMNNRLDTHAATRL